MAAQNMKDHQNIQLRIMNIIIIHIILLGANPMLVRARQVLQYRFSRSFDVIIDNWLEINEALNLETNRYCSIQIILWSSQPSHSLLQFWLSWFSVDLSQRGWQIYLKYSPKFKILWRLSQDLNHPWIFFIKLATVTWPCIVLL